MHPRTIPKGPWHAEPIKSDTPRHAAPADALKRQAVRPVICYPVEGLPRPGLAPYLFAPLRFSEVRRKVEAVSERMLAQTLQVLESGHLVRRQARDVAPPHVDYTLTLLGHEVTVRVMPLAGWIETNLPALLGNPQP